MVSEFEYKKHVIKVIPYRDENYEFFVTKVDNVTLTNDKNGNIVIYFSTDTAIRAGKRKVRGILRNDK